MLYALLRHCGGETEQPKLIAPTRSDGGGKIGKNVTTCRIRVSAKVVTQNSMHGRDLRHLACIVVNTANSATQSIVTRMQDALSNQRLQCERPPIHLHGCDGSEFR